MTTYKCCKSSLSRSISSDKVNGRTLNNKLRKMEDALHALHIALHAVWLSKAEITSEQLETGKYSSEWLESEWEEISVLQDNAEEILEINSAQVLPPAQSVDQKLHISCKQMESLQLDINLTIGNLLNKTSSEENSASYKIYRDMLANVRDRQMHHMLVAEVSGWRKAKLRYLQEKL